MQETLTIGIMGADCAKRKKDIQREARRQKMSVSALLLWLFEEYQKNHALKQAAGINR